MPKAATETNDAVRFVLESATCSRDALPYTDECDELLREFNETLGKKVSRQDFWRKISNAAKKGGWKGKGKGQAAPNLTLQQTDVLRSLAAGKLGSRDSLAYTSDFEEIREQFNTTTTLSLSHHEIWRLLCNLGKRSRKPEVKALLKQATDSLIMGIEHFNRPSDCGRVSSVLILLDHAAEMLLKSALLDRGGDIRNPKSGFAHSLETCLNKATDDADLKFLTADERRTFLVLNGLRDQAQHYLVDVSEQILYTVAQSMVTLVTNLLPRLYGRRLSDELPKRVLPISINPPQDIQVLMDEEFSQLKQLLGANVDSTTEPKLRSLLAVDRALNGQPTQVSDEELKAVVADVRTKTNWQDVFNGISQIKLTGDGSGVGVSLQITKNEGIPVRVVKEGEDPQAVIAVRKVNDTDFYCFRLTVLSEKRGLTAPRTTALIRYLQLQKKEDCFKRIMIGRSEFKMYSSNALRELRKALDEVDMEEVWEKHNPNNRKPRKPR